MHIRVLGAGLAGCEAALYLAGRGYAVELWEQKPHKFSPAHKNADFAELVCSNSLKADRLDSASGLLKAEMKLLGSALLPVAEGCRVAAGGALAVDREAFAAGVTALVKGNPNITLRTGEAQAVGEAEPDTLVLTATGPLTEGALAQDIARLTGRGALSFYDAAAPIVTADSIDRDRVFAASRYGRGTADYLNCPFDKAGYEAFHAALAGAERAPLHDFDGEPSVYEGCMPIEVMAKRGADTMRYGPLRPVGLTDPKTGRRPWANVQLRAEDAAQTAMLRLWRSGQAFPDDNQLRHWLVRVTVNACKDALRSPWRRRMVPLDDCREPVFNTPEHQNLYAEVMALPAKYRLPLYLYYYEGYTAAEVGELLGLGPSTVRTRLARAREKLKAQLREE